MATHRSLPGTQAIRQTWKNARNWLEEDRIFGKSLLWFVSGWRLGAIVLIAALIFPQEYSDNYILIAIGIGNYILLALGLNIVVGYAGLLDLGYVAFFIVGNYTYAALSGSILDNAQKQPVIAPYISFWWLIPLGVLLAGLAGVLLGAPTLRLRGDYLAIVTLGFGAIAQITVLNLPFFGGANGLSPFRAPLVHTPLGAVNFGNVGDHTAFYYLLLVAVVLVVFLVGLLRNSSLGRAWVAIREDETAAAASGVNLVRTKLLAFGMGAAIAGLAGVLSAAVQGIITPEVFSFNYSITILVMIVLGGIGSIPGVIIGATLLGYFQFQLLDNVQTFIHGNPLVSSTSSPLHFLSTVDLGQNQFLIYGLVLLVMVLLRPQGIIPDRRRQRELRAATSVEEASAVGILAIEQAGGTISGMGGANPTEYTGPGSDAQGREEQ